MDWKEYIIKLCELRDALHLMDDYDPEHPIFQAIDEAKPEMDWVAHDYCQAVIKEYSAEVALRQRAALQRSR